MKPTIDPTKDTCGKRRGAAVQEIEAVTELTSEREWPHYPLISKT